MELTESTKTTSTQLQSPQDVNGASLIALWNLGEKLFAYQVKNITASVAKIERNTYLGPCQAETGYEYPCHRTASVTDLESERRMCIRCFREIA